MKRRHYIGITIMILGIIGLIIGATNRVGAEVKEALVCINGIDIAEEEYRMFLQDQKALTVNYFTQTYQAEYGPNFWHNAYKEEVPLDYAKNHALETLKRVKVEQEVAKELGVVKAIDFESIVEEMRKEKSIYGVENMDTFRQYSVYHSKIVLEALEVYKKNYSSISDEEIKQKYEAIKETVFMREDHIEAIILEINIFNLEQSQEVLDRIMNAIAEGITIDGLIERFGEVCEIKATLKSYGEVEGKDENTEDLGQILREKAYDLKSNEISSPMEYGQNYYSVLCLEREEKGIAPFEEVEIVVEDQIKEEKFEVEIQKRMENAKVVKDEERYEAIEMQ